MELKGSKTEKNLMDAFAGESQARNKYTYYASQAKKDGMEQIAEIFTKTADNEKEHAKMWFKLFHGIGSTYENLLDAAAGERHEWTIMYKEMAKVADEEGFHEIAQKMRLVADIEENHEARYRKLAENIKIGKVFEKEEAVVWECRNCGHRYFGKKPPEVCQTCNHPQSYFEVHQDNF